MCSKCFLLVHAGFKNLDVNSVPKGRACLMLGRQNTWPSHQLLKPKESHYKHQDVQEPSRPTGRGCCTARDRSHSSMQHKCKWKSAAAHGTSREKKNKHTAVLPSPSDLVFWEYTGTLTALYVTLCKSKSLYQRKHWWTDSSNSQADFMQRAPLTDNMFCIFWTIGRQLLQISPTLLHLATFTYSLEIKF